MSGIDYEAYEDEWEDDARAPRPRTKESLSTDARDRIADHPVGRVVAVDRGRVTLLLDDEIVHGTYAGTMRGDKVVVGDEVRVRPARHDNDLPRVADRLPRERILLRTADDALDDERDERIVVANVDQVAVVVGADYLEGGLGFLDRVLVAASVGGIDPLVVLNKIDLADADEVAATVGRYEEAGYDVVRTSAATGDGLDALRWRLADCWTVFTGHSGVGKSSLFNLLVPDADQQVGEIGARGGRHTTTASLALRVPGLGEDSWLVDTPGVRSFGLGTVEPETLHLHLPELADADPGPVGAVGAPVPNHLVGRISRERLDAYRRLLASLRGEQVG